MYENCKMENITSDLIFFVNGKKVSITPIKHFSYLNLTLNNEK